MSTPSGKHDPGGLAIATPRIQRLAVKDVIDALRISRSSMSSPKTQARKPLPASTSTGHTADPNSGFPDVVCWYTKQWSCKTVPDHRSDREEFVRQLIARIDKSDGDLENLLIYRVDPGDR